MDKNNTLNVLRLISAVFVIIYHSCPLTGNFSSLFGILAGIGIGTFFIISGYFIIQSWFSDPTPSRFLWKRLLRLVPELAAMVIFPIFFIGPINTRLSLQEYFFDKEYFYRSIGNMAVVMILWLNFAFEFSKMI